MAILRAFSLAGTDKSLYSCVYSIFARQKEAVVNFPGRPIRFVLTCLVAAGVGGGETCWCGSLPVACQRTALGGNLPVKSCCCCAKAGRGCCCHGACCRKQTPLKSSPGQSDHQNTGKGASGWVKGLVVTMAAHATAAGRRFAGAPYELASSASPATLQFEHVRLQI